MIDLALVSYTAVMSITPGPNNLMLAASGVNFGFRRTLPHLLGISLGVVVQLVLVALLLGSALAWFQTVRPWLAVAGCAYLLWLSWRIFRSGQPEGRESARPLGFLGALAFQFVNPKAWVMSVNTALVFVSWDAALAQSLILISLVFLAVNLPCIALWAFTGDRLRRWLAQPKPLLIFNSVMGGLMALTALVLLVEELRPLAAGIGWDRAGQ